MISVIPTPRYPMSVHKTQAGDTLTKIAAKYGTSVQKLAELNGIDLSRNFLLPANLKLPTGAMNKSSFRSAPAQGASAPAGGGASGSKVLDAAMGQLGQKQDCTALVERALRAAGKKDVGDESPASLRKFGTPVSDPKPGDIIYYNDAGAGVPHVAIYAGKDASGKPIAVHGGWNGNDTAIAPVNIGTGPVSYHRP